MRITNWLAIKPLIFKKFFCYPPNLTFSSLGAGATRSSHPTPCIILHHIHSKHIPVVSISCRMRVQQLESFIFNTIALSKIPSITQMSKPPHDNDNSAPKSLAAKLAELRERSAQNVARLQSVGEMISLESSQYQSIQSTMRHRFYLTLVWPTRTMHTHLSCITPCR